NCEVISYEAPFGVGYLVAQLSAVSEPPAVAGGLVAEDQPPATAGGSDSIPALARSTIETFVTTGNIISPPPDLPNFFKARAGCFVSIKTLDRDLRGCIGTVEPVKKTLAEEIIY